MNKRDDFHELDGPSPSSELEAHMPPKAVRAKKHLHAGRWAAIAACLVLVAALAVAAPTLLRHFRLGGHPNPLPVTVSPTPDAPTISDEELTALLAAKFPDPYAGDAHQLSISVPGEGVTMGVLHYE